MGCGQRSPQSELVRLSATGKDGLGAANATPFGRSAYLHPAGDCVRAMTKSRLIDRSLRIRPTRKHKERFGAALLETLEPPQGVL